MCSNFSKRTVFQRWFSSLTAAGAFALLCFTASGVTITNVSVVNVTPSGFDVVWRVESSTPSIAIFADAGGVTNLAHQVGIEAYPLHTGSPQLAAGYDRRLGQEATRQKTRNFGLVMMRVNGCRPGRTYYYRLTSTPSPGTPAVYPASGPLPSVTLPGENTFVVNDQSLILEVPALDAEGRILLLTHSNAPVALAAVVGDGARTNQVFFHLNDLFALAGGGNFGALGAQEFSVTVLGASQADIFQKFTVVFGAGFAVGQGTSYSIGTEFLAAYLGSTVVRSGQNASVPITANTSTTVGGLDLMLDIPAGHFGSLTLQSLAPEIDPLTSSVTSQGGTAWRVRFRPRAGQAITGEKQLALLNGTTLPGQTSAFVPLRVTGVTATHPDASAVKNLFAQSGRVVVVADQPLLEAFSETNGQRRLALYGIPGVAYGIEKTPTFAPQAGWSAVTHFVARALTTSLPAGGMVATDVFYRALEFNPDPPVLDIAMLFDGSLELTIYGRTGTLCALQSAASLGAPWVELSQVLLTNGVAFVSVPKGQGNGFFRVVPLTNETPVSALEWQPDGSLRLTVSARPGTASLVEYTTSLGSPWKELTHFPMVSGLERINLPTGIAGNGFYRVVPFAPDPPVLEALLAPGGARTLLTYGQAGRQYTVLAATNVSNPVASWTPALSYTLTNAFRYLTPPTGGTPLFYRLRRN
jgi:hypothetical protein